MWSDYFLILGSKNALFSARAENNSIAERYGTNFVFNINDFGFEYFKFAGKYWLCGGIPA